jgi:hypothetical protein
LRKYKSLLKNYQNSSRKITATSPDTHHKALSTSVPFQAKTFSKVLKAAKSEAKSPTINKAVMAAVNSRSKSTKEASPNPNLISPPITSSIASIKLTTQPKIFKASG